MKIIFEFEFDNEFVSEDATIIYRYNEKMLEEHMDYWCFNDVMYKIHEFFDFVIGAESKEEVKEYYEFTKKSESFQGSKNIP